jgi:hypothetical protein
MRFPDIQRPEYHYFFGGQTREEDSNFESLRPIASRRQREIEQAWGYGALWLAELGLQVTGSWSYKLARFWRYCANLLIINDWHLT